jgi:nicotinate-nucleotide adenylyltransferase
MRLGVLGGTFNPIHYGHLRAAEEARERLGLERVLFVPAGNPPLKSSELADAGKRYAMTELAVAGNGWFELSDIELKSTEKSYTVDTMKRLGERYPGAEFYFILGIDAFMEMSEWREPDRLVGATDFVLLNRPPHAFAALAASPYLDVSEEALGALDSGRETMRAVTLRGGRTAFLLRAAPLDISSTTIRSLVRNGRSIKYLLPESVESFIITDGLYAE